MRLYKITILELQTSNLNNAIFAKFSIIKVAFKNGTSKNINGFTYRVSL